jgi:hypothetical protein
MITRTLAMVKPFALSLFAVAFFAMAQGVARADEVTISGSTTGTVSGVPQLTFAGNAFTGTTALGVGSLSGTNRLGTFTLSTAPLQSINGSFTMNVMFTAPAGITGGQGSTFTATIVGSVSPNVGQGGVNITFANSTQVFTFSNGGTTGSFTLTIPDIFVQSGNTANLTAGISGAQQTTVPEPATLLLLGTGLSGIAAGVRRRRNRNSQK